MVDSGSPLSTASRDSATSPPSSAISSSSRKARSRDCTPPSLPLLPLLPLLPGPLVSTMCASLLTRARCWAVRRRRRGPDRDPDGRAVHRRRLDPTGDRGYVFHITEGTFRITGGPVLPVPRPGAAAGRHDTQGES